jgi:hypothetical protein
MRIPPAMRSVVRLAFTAVAVGVWPGVVVLHLDLASRAEF